MKGPCVPVTASAAFTKEPKAFEPLVTASVAPPPMIASVAAVVVP